MIQLPCSEYFVGMKSRWWEEWIHPAGSISSVSHPENVFLSIKSWLLCREMRPKPSMDSGRQMIVVGVGHQIWRWGLGPFPTCGWSQNWKLGGRFSGLWSGWVNCPAKPQRFFHFCYNSLGESSRTPSPLCPGAPSVPQKVPKGSSWQGDNISDFKHTNFIWIVVDWHEQMMLLHVLVAWFLLQCECAHEQQQVFSKCQADPWVLCKLALADGVEGERREPGGCLTL